MWFINISEITKPSSPRHQPQLHSLNYQFTNFDFLLQKAHQKESHLFEEEKQHASNQANVQTG